jgi:pyrroline-5-carboxylate reductase
MKIAFIGGGNVATALISGISQSPLPPEFIHVSDPDERARRTLEENFPVTGFNNAPEAIRDTHCIVLAVKPQVMPEVLAEIRGQIEPGQLIITVAAGITIDYICRMLGSEQEVIRCMPNTPALIGRGVTGLVAGPGCTPQHRKFAERILTAAGEIVWLDDEALMDVVTAISGSGPAYYYYLTELLKEAGTALGLPAEAAEKLALYTAQGAGDMAVQSHIGIAELRRQVTTPGGTTEAALGQFKAGGLQETVFRAIQAATERGRELSHIGDAT